ncbi:MAG: DUF2149 domain-containing protein [Actinomycetota bacterium]|nr:DUF2149 domain-containing protein [Actinomycetota bacterium]MDI6821769.1 DUF2149 domain-containing protein [Actinomycetota bacterium]
MIRKRKILPRLEEDINPMSGVANLVDAMLVFACGLIVTLVLSWNLQNVIFKDTSLEERRRMMEAIKRIVKIEQGKEIKTPPPLVSGTGEGYEEMGVVYKDSKTGKLIMVSP